MSTWNSSRARSFAALLARPRGCGTPDERWAAERVREAFREAGLETTEEFFHFRPSGDAVASSLLAFGLASLGLVWAALAEPWLAVGGLAALAALAWLGPPVSTALLMRRARGAREPEPPPAGWVRTSNVVGRAPGPPGSPLFVFVGHYDSKSQNMPITVRVGLFVVLGFAGLTAVQLAVLRVWTGSPPALPIHALFAAAFAAALPLLLLRTGNRSPGALDNATGAACVVELARLWRDHPLSWKSRAIFLCPSAEEHGLVGSRLWVARHAAELLSEPRCRVLNFDGCAAADGTLVVLPPAGPVADAFLAAARAADVPLRRMPLGVGLLADHVPFAEAGIPVASLLSRGKGTSLIHTAGDAADLLEDAAFDAAGRVILGAIDALAR
ncbi:MAG: M28 family peptidase [Planctomycetia bacterium]|nr:M28 family peptidase [Planctomycetia bacterium]